MNVTYGTLVPMFSYKIIIIESDIRKKAVHYFCIQIAHFQ